MTSLIRVVSQIPAQLKYLYAVTNTNAWVPNTSTTVSSIFPYSDFASAFASITAIPANSEMRDLGKFIVLTNSSGQHYALLRLVQTVNGPSSEGVPANWETGNTQYYVCTWSSDPVTINVTVARTG